MDHLFYECWNFQLGNIKQFWVHRQCSKVNRINMIFCAFNFRSQLLNFGWIFFSLWKKKLKNEYTNKYFPSNLIVEFNSIHFDIIEKIDPLYILKCSIATVLLLQASSWSNRKQLRLNSTKYQFCYNKWQSFNKNSVKRNWRIGLQTIGFVLFWTTIFIDHNFWTVLYGPCCQKKIWGQKIMI